MGFFVSNATIDASLDYLATCTIMVVCSEQPTTYTELTDTYALADVVIAGGDFTKAGGDVSGRKTTVAAKNDVEVDASGEATHVGHGISGSSTLVWVTECVPQVLTEANMINIGAHKHEILAATGPD